MSVLLSICSFCEECGLWDLGLDALSESESSDCEECELSDLVLDTLSESDGSLSLSVDTEYGRIKFKEQSLHVGGM